MAWIKPENPQVPLPNLRPCHSSSDSAFMGGVLGRPQPLAPLKHPLPPLLPVTAPARCAQATQSILAHGEGFGGADGLCPDGAAADAQSRACCPASCGGHCGGSQCAVPGMRAPPPVARAANMDCPHQRIIEPAR